MESYWEKKADVYMSGQGGRDVVTTTPTRRLVPGNTPPLANGEGSSPSPAQPIEEDSFDADDSFTGDWESLRGLEDYEEEEF